MAAYYNEIDPFAAEWLRVLIAYGHIAFGHVDTRSIEDVTPSDIAGYTQCHFFAGIGGWSYALRLSGWPDSRHVWTLSCPCQPFSAAGKGGGFADERHLWPAAHWLIAQRRPVTIFGEQVASKDGLGWLDTVQTDLERTAYSSGAVDICAASVGAPHIRQRLYWRSDSQILRRSRWSDHLDRRGREFPSGYSSSVSNGVGTDAANSRLPRTEDTSSDRNYESQGPRGLQSERSGYSSNGVGPDAVCSRCGARWSGQAGDGSGETREQLTGLCVACIRSDSSSTRFQKQFFNRKISRETVVASAREAFIGRGYTRGFWSGCDWWHGRDEKYRPIESGLFPLAHGVPGRVGKLRGYGNAIVPELAAEFIQASEEMGQL